MASHKGSFRSLFCFWVFLLLGLAPWRAAANITCDLPIDRLKTLKAVVVAEVYDGDTLLLRGGQKVRLIGINTPETKKPDRPGEPLAKQAKKALQVWQGKQLLLQYGKEPKDRYGRVLGHLFSPQGANITASLLVDGYGFLVAIPPNDDYSGCYLQRSLQAKRKEKGVWGNAYHGLRSVSLPADLKGGFGRYRGKVERIYIAKKVIWIDLYGHVSLRVARKDVPYLKGEALEQILRAADEKTAHKLPHIEFSGWLMDRTQWGKKMAAKVKAGKRKRWQMNIRHRNHWQMPAQG